MRLSLGAMVKVQDESDHERACNQPEDEDRIHQVHRHPPAAEIHLESCRALACGRLIDSAGSALTGPSADAKCALVDRPDCYMHCHSRKR